MLYIYLGSVERRFGKKNIVFSGSFPEEKIETLIGVQNEKWMGELSFLKTWKFFASSTSF
jgi:hypothetical protein